MNNNKSIVDGSRRLLYGQVRTIAISQPASQPAKRKLFEIRIQESTFKWILNGCFKLVRPANKETIFSQTRHEHNSQNFITLSSLSPPPPPPNHGNNNKNSPICLAPGKILSSSLLPFQNLECLAGYFKLLCIIIISLWSTNNGS